MAGWKSEQRTTPMAAELLYPSPSTFILIARYLMRSPCAFPFIYPNKEKH